MRQKARGDLSLCKTLKCVSFCCCSGVFQQAREEFSWPRCHVRMQGAPQEPKVESSDEPGSRGMDLRGGAGMGSHIHPLLPGSSHPTALALSSLRTFARLPSPLPFLPSPSRSFLCLQAKSSHLLE